MLPERKKSVIDSRCGSGRKEIGFWACQSGRECETGEARDGAGEKPFYTMKSSIRLAALAALILGAGSLRAETITITGEGKCAKCSLKEASSCQNVVEVKDGDKKVKKYYLTGKVSKAYHHENLCAATKQVKVKGELTEKDGKMMVEVETIEDAPAAK